MKLLICTQAVDLDDPILGFFVRWIEELARHHETVTVICLREGRHELPDNVRVVCLGSSRVRRVIQLWRLSIAQRREYDAVFVHMNQEYILVAGWIWKALRKRVYLWRNHYAGSWLTDVASTFCTKVFCTSKHSYTAKYKKTVLMPVGVDTERFFLDEHIARKPHSILFLARIAPSKRVEMLVDALTTLSKNGVDFTATIVGSPLPKDELHYHELIERVHAAHLEQQVTFSPGVPNSQTPDLYRAHEIFVNTSPSGMLDKTIFEAAACGCIVLAASEEWIQDVMCKDAQELATRLTSVIGYSAEEHMKSQKKQQARASEQSLAKLIAHLRVFLAPDEKVVARIVDHEAEADAEEKREAKR